MLASVKIERQMKAIRRRDDCDGLYSHRHNESIGVFPLRTSARPLRRQRSLAAHSMVLNRSARTGCESLQLSAFSCQRRGFWAKAESRKSKDESAES
jgi:hypothetical protein